MAKFEKCLDTAQDDPGSNLATGGKQFKVYFILFFLIIGHNGS